MQDRTKRRVFSFILLLFVLAVTETASRVYLAATEFSGKRALLTPGRIIYGYYPELEAVLRERAARDDGGIHILFLGGSALADFGHGAIRPILTETISSRTGRPVTIHSVAVPTFSSLDAYYMYKRLRAAPFDLVIYYESINEVRANSCPRALFRADYSHYSWYRSVNMIERHKELSVTASPFVFHKLFVWLGRTVRSLPDVPMQKPNDEWVGEGAEIKTAGSFRQNLEGIIEIAQEKGDPLLLVSFAYYIPADYSIGRFRAKQLDYTGYLCPIELWGKPENVEAGIRAHNGILRTLYADHVKAGESRLYFFDLETEMPKDGACFDDICHLTRRGSEEFVARIRDSVLGALREPKLRLGT